MVVWPSTKKKKRRGEARKRAKVGENKGEEEYGREEVGETETTRAKRDQRPMRSGTRASLLREQPDREATRNTEGPLMESARKTGWKEMRCEQRDDGV